MKITDIRSMLLLGPRLHAVGGGESIATKLVIRVDTDEGVYGLGEADYFMGVREGVDYIRTALVGRNPLDIRPYFSEMVYGNVAPHLPDSYYNEPRHSTDFGPVTMCSPTATPTGPIVWAMSGVEMALTDLAGKVMGVPVYRLLGGGFRDRVRVYLDRSAPEDVDDLDAWRLMGEQVVEDGFTQMKFDVDYAAPDYVRDIWNRTISAPQMNRIVERLAAVRETTGWDVEIAVDLHMQYNAIDAIRLANDLAHLKISWLEDPTPITNPDSCAEVKAKSPIPICVGEMFIAEQFRLFIDQKACDIIHPDIMFAGGVHETARIADYAELHHIPMAMHGNGGALATVAAAHVASASRNFLGLEYHFIETPWIGEFIKRDGLPLFEEGHVPLSDAPGLGVELDEEVCLEHLAPGESMF